MSEITMDNELLYARIERVECVRLLASGEIEEMSRTHSISTRRLYGMSRVCRIWGVPRATFYRHCCGEADTANSAHAQILRGPARACSDTELLTHIEAAVIAASPFSGEGYRTVWARLRAQGVRTAARRVRRIMKQSNLLAPQRPVQHDTRVHDGAIVTD